MAMPASDLVCRIEFIKLMVSISIVPDLANKRGMAGNAVSFDPVGTIPANLNPLLKGIEGKSSRVIPTVPGFGQIFIKETISRQMTFNAGRLTGVRTVLPGSILSIHYMAIYTGFGIVGQVGQSL